MRESRERTSRPGRTGANALFPGPGTPPGFIRYFSLFTLPVRIPQIVRRAEWGNNPCIPMAEKCPAATIPNNFSSYLTIYLLP